MPLDPVQSFVVTPAPGDILADGLLDGLLLPFLALLITALGRRVIEGAAFKKWTSSAEIGMDATLTGAVACDTVFTSPFLEQLLPHTGRSV